MPGVEQQRKQVTVLFADVSGFTAMSETMDAEDVSEVMNAIWQRLDAAILAWGGVIDKHIGDAVMALWGTETTREDDPERAIRAALDMQSQLRRFAEGRPMPTPLRMRIGINTGPVLLGEVGTTGEFTAMGDTVNTASRLEHAAPVGGILISHDTRERVRGFFEMATQKPLTVKGKSEPLEVFTITRANPRAFRLQTRGIEGVQTPMIGREAELEFLQDVFYATAQNRERHMVTIAGEAGLGKSRLLQEFRAWLEALPKQVLIFKGRADVAMGSRPYALLRDIFSFHFQVQDSDSSQEVRRKLEQGIVSVLGSGEESQKKAHFIGHLLGFDFSDSPHLRQALEEPKEIRDQSLQFVREFLVEVAGDNPAVILLEDLHWADDSSLDALTHLMTRMAESPVLMICLARPPLFQRRPKWAKEQAFHRLVELQPLSPKETGRLVGAILAKVEEVPPLLLDLIVENSQGNPFYAEELIKMLIEDEVIITSSAQWLVNPARLTEVRIPPTLTGVLQARLDSLTPKEKDVLQRAAVIGRAFWDEVLAYLTGEDAPGKGESEAADVETMQVLETLERRELIAPQEAAAFEGVHEYAFNNVILREVTYESVLKRERRALHARVAQWLIDRSGDRVQEYAGLIAEHLERAQQNSEAVAYLKYAGERAQQVSAFHESLAFFKRALALLAASEREERLVLMRQIGRALYELGHWDAAKAQMEESLKMARAMANPREIANSLRTLGFIAEQEGRYAEAKERLQESLNTARSMADPQQMVASLRALGNLAERQGSYVEAKARLEESLSLARQYGDKVSMAQAAAVQGALDRMSGAYGTAKNRVSERLTRIQSGVGERRERLGKSFGALGRLRRRRGADEEE